MALPLGERAPAQDTRDKKPDIHKVPDLSPQERDAARAADAAQVHQKIEAMRAKTEEFDTAALAKVKAELSAATWEGSPLDTKPTMAVAESGVTELDRALGEAKGMELRLKDAGIDPDDLAAGKVGLWKRLTHGQLIHDWTEANKAVAELGPKGGVDRSAEQRAGRRARMMTPPKAPRSPFGLG